MAALIRTRLEQFGLPIEYTPRDVIVLGVSIVILLRGEVVTLLLIPTLVELLDVTGVIMSYNTKNGYCTSYQSCSRNGWDRPQNSLGCYTHSSGGDLSSGLCTVPFQWGC